MPTVVRLSVGFVLLLSVGTARGDTGGPAPAVNPPSRLLTLPGMPQLLAHTAQLAPGQPAPRGWNLGPQPAVPASLTLWKEYDPYGFRRYTLLFDTLSAQPPVHLRARMMKPTRSSDFQATRRITALGVAIPWRELAFEFEGIKDPDLGHSLLGTLRWTDPGDRFGCALTVPMASTGDTSPAVIVQFMLRLDRD